MTERLTRLTRTWNDGSLGLTQRSALHASQCTGVLVADRRGGVSGIFWASLPANREFVHLLADGLHVREQAGVRVEQHAVQALDAFAQLRKG